MQVATHCVVRCQSQAGFVGEFCYRSDYQFQCQLFTTQLYSFAAEILRCPNVGYRVLGKKMMNSTQTDDTLANSLGLPECCLLSAT